MSIHSIEIVSIAALKIAVIAMREWTDVEEVVTGHSGLAGHSSRDDDDLSILEALLESVVLRGETLALSWMCEYDERGSVHGRKKQR